MPLVELGRILRPHGFRGAFIVRIPSGTESALGDLPKIAIGRSEAEATLFTVSEAAWMPKGWKVQVEEITTEEGAKALAGQAVYAERESLPAPADGQYYIADLIGSSVQEVETEKIIGTFLGADNLVAPNAERSSDRWWVDTGKDRLAIPATKRFIARVDLAARVIWVQNLEELG